MRFDPFQIVQIIYWLALSTWFGAVLFVAWATPIIFRTVREANPVLPDVLSVNLEGAHGTLLAGSIVGYILRRLVTIELICGGALLVAQIAQWNLIDLEKTNLTAAILRGILFLVAVGAVLYDSRVVSPRMWKERQTYMDHADEAEVAVPAKEQFDRDHKLGVTLMGAVVFLLLGMILFSGSISPAPHGLELPATSGR